MFGPLIASYMFLGGAAAGTSFTGSLLTIFVPAWRSTGPHGRLSPTRSYARLFGGMFGSSLVVLAFGCTCLVADLGQPLRAINLFLHPTLSYISVGAFAILALMAEDLVLGALWNGMLHRLPLGRGFAHAVALLAMLTSTVVMVYTGMYLAQAKAVALWALGPVVPVLFLASSGTTGLALTLLSACLSGAAVSFQTLMRRLVRAGIGFAIAELVLFVTMLALAARAGGMPSTHEILAGRLAPAFWLSLVLVGLLIPLVVELLHARSSSTGIMMATSLLVLVGGLALRICVVGAGLNPLVMRVAS